ncbi:MAG: NAD(+) diphosphatase [Treponema sp.]|jgi:NAD+ diphosphatase|nr:NAD(+) diphosphatase [Treponema sp.]
MKENLSRNGSFFVFQGNSIVSPDDFIGSEFPVNLECPEEKIMNDFSGLRGADFFCVPALDDTPLIRILTLPSDFSLLSEWKLIPVRRILDLFAAEGRAGDLGQTGRLMRAYHISLWRGESRFCGSCGSENSDAANGEFARLCPRCGRMEFPRISPAVITLITNDRDEALLAHNRKFAPGLYSLIAGFNEAGENLESTVAREIREETGIEVKDIQYIRSQPWPFPNSLMAGFTASYASGTIKPDGDEIEEARWFTRDNLPLLPGRASISRYLIELWLEKKL